MSGFWFGTPASPYASTGSAGAPTGFGENYDAGLDEAVKLNRSISENVMLSEAYARRIDDIRTKTGKVFANPMDDAGDIQAADPRQSPQVFNARGTRGTRIDAFEKEVDALRAQFPDIEDRAGMLGRLSREAADIEEKTFDVSSRATTAGGFGAFAGGMVGAMTDPVNAMATIATLPAGGEGGAAMQILRTALREAGVNAASEAVIQTQVQPMRERLGLESGIDLATQNVMYAGAGGAVFGASAKSIGLGYDHLFGKDLLDKFDADVAQPTSDQHTARAVYARALDEDGQSPFGNSAPAAAEHAGRLKSALDALENGTAANMPETPVSSPRPASTQTIGDNLDQIVYRFNPDDIGVDAKTFQFKEGGDNAGVTERLRGVTEWDPVKAGQVIVYEYQDGSRFIADGHQRVGLAKRLAAAGAKDVSLYGQLFRETDGFSPADIRVVAAMKNIAEGTGTAVDAAKVLRVAPERMGELPPASVLVRQANDLTNLTDDAFGMVVNDVVPANYAAVVGRLVPDDGAMQKAVLDVLAKTDPANIVQAESIARQAIDAGTARETQTGLFGEETLTTSLFLERAKVLDKALKNLRQDRKVFDSLVRNEGRISSEGNVLDTAANASQADIAARIEQQVHSLANRKGPVSEALTNAARRFKDEKRLASAADDFVDALRTALGAADGAGDPAGSAGRNLQTDAENAPRPQRPGPIQPDEAALNQFDEPAGAGAQAQADALEADLQLFSTDNTNAGAQNVIPGAERISDKELVERKSGERLKPKAAQKPADDGLFDIAGRSQEDLFNAVPVGERIDPATGKIVPDLRTIDDVLEDAARDQADIDAIGSCKL